MVRSSGDGGASSSRREPYAQADADPRRLLEPRRRAPGLAGAGQRDGRRDLHGRFPGGGVRAPELAVQPPARAFERDLELAERVIRAEAQVGAPEVLGLDGGVRGLEHVAVADAEPGAPADPEVRADPRPEPGKPAER